MFKIIFLPFLLVLVFIGCTSEKKVRIISDLEQGIIYIKDKKVGEIRISYDTLFLEEGKHDVLIKKLSTNKEWLYSTSKELNISNEEIQIFEFSSYKKEATQKRIKRLKKEKEEKNLFVKKLGLSKINNSVYLDMKNGFVWNNTLKKSSYVTWENAAHYCKNLSLLGLNSWRLPFISELKTLVNKRNSNNMTSGIKKISKKGIIYWAREDSLNHSENKKHFSFSWMSESSSPAWGKFANKICVKSTDDVLEKRLKKEEIKNEKALHERNKIAKEFNLSTYPKNVFLDRKTKLMWQNDKKGIQEQKRNESVYCKNLSQKISKKLQYDWRLPTVEELQVLHRKPKPKYLNVSPITSIGYETADKKGYTSNILVYDNTEVKKSYSSFIRCVYNKK